MGRKVPRTPETAIRKQERKKARLKFSGETMKSPSGLKILNAVRLRSKKSKVTKKHAKKSRKRSMHKTETNVRRNDRVPQRKRANRAQTTYRPVKRCQNPYFPAFRFPFLYKICLLYKNAYI